VLCVYHSDTILYLNKQSPTATLESGQRASTMALINPTYRFAMELRISLGIRMMKQALCTMPIKDKAMIYALNDTPPLMVTKFAKRVGGLR
jgi:hypothetical protein